MNPDGLLGEDAEEGARFGLLSLMSGISEEAWCAGWLKDLEFKLWRACSGGSVDDEVQFVTPRQAELLKLLSEEAGGWWTYDLAHGPVFLRAEEWLRRVRERSSQA